MNSLQNLQTINKKGNLSEGILSIVSKDIRKIGDSTDNHLFEYIEELTNRYNQSVNIKERKLKGQFFTPKQISLFMASLFEVDKQNITLLDPGAGLGILSAAFCYNILNNKTPVSLSIDAYENDPGLIPYLEEVFKKCKKEMERKGHKLIYKIINQDFILNKLDFNKQISLFRKHKEINSYDYIISNPPYYKLNKDSVQSQLMIAFTSGQPNIYAFFMALSMEMLKQDGQMVFITPRSFCSGLYFKRFREWLLEHGTINNIHVFESRSSVFNKKEVLQENIIVKISKTTNDNRKKKVKITKSKDCLFNDFVEMNIDYEGILHKKNGDIFIKIPIKESDLKVQNIIDSWNYTLKDLDMKVSTGPVVSFRAKDLLSATFKDKKTTSPLLWMHNIRGFDVVWPLEKKKKEIVIKLGKKADPLLVPTNNYVLIKRFSSKEQKRRLYAGVLLKSDFDFEMIGIENHLNYIYKCNGCLTIEEAYGIAGLLNSSIVDEFFRMLNGNTQVNAVDIMNLPFPSLEDIRTIGGYIINKKPSIGQELDKAILNILGIDTKIIKDIYKEAY